jgi:uncharacterized protein
MSTLTDRLRGIVGGAVPRVAPELRPPGREGEEGTSAGQGSLDAPPVPSHGLSDASLGRAAEVLGGTVTTTAAGAAIVVDRQYAAMDRHGSVTIGEIADVLLEGEESLALLTRAWPSARPDSLSRDVPSREVSASRESSRSLQRSLWFLDLETTGLAGGAGTQAFLVGCARLDGDGLSVRQFLLPGYEHERALLAEVSTWAAAQGAIVTFNGKSFDVPLIETRYLFHRQPFPLEGRAHVDMVHPARRLWRARGELEGSIDASCSLGTLERLLAGVHRVGDVPGYEIPSRYFQFVRDGDARRLHSVLEHNRLDLVSLALVMARAITLVERGPAAATTPYECYGLARIYDRAGRHDDAEAAYVRAIDYLARVGRDPETWAHALRRLAYCRRRAGRWREAAEAWQELANLPRCPATLLHEAREGLAIYHEHRARDLDTARAHARLLVGDMSSARQHDAAEHRLHRIERKLARDAAAGRQWHLDLEPRT